MTINDQNFLKIEEIVIGNTKAIIFQNNSTEDYQTGVIIEAEKNINFNYISSELINFYFVKLMNINTNSLRIPHYGESHCLSFANQNISSSSQKIKIQPVLITGGKAWHFAMNKNNRWKDSLIQQMKHHKYSKKVFISYGFAISYTYNRQV